MAEDEEGKKTKSEKSSEPEANHQLTTEPIEDYNSIYNREEWYYAITLVVIPFSLFFVMTIFYDFIPDYQFAFFVLPLGVFVIVALSHSIIYWKTPAIISIRKKRDRLKKFGYKKLLIRNQFFSMYSRITVVVLIIISLVVGVGYQILTEQIAKNDAAFLQKISQYQEQVKQVDEMSRENLIIFLNNGIINMYFPDQFKMFLVDVNIVGIHFSTEDTPIENNLSNLDVAFNSITRDEAIVFTQNAVKTMTDSDLKKSAKIILKYSEPKRLFYDNSNFIRLQNYLLGILSIPVFMLYGIYTVRYTLVKFQEYEYYLTLGCFYIIRDSRLAEHVQRKYVALGLNYYNKYIQKHSRQQIRDIDQIVSFLLTMHPLQITICAETILHYLEKHHRLQLLYILELEIGNEDSTKFLTRDYPVDRIKGWLPFIIPTISAIIAALSLMLKH